MGERSKSASWKTTSKRGDSASFWEKGESMSSRKEVWQWGQRRGEGRSVRDTLISHSWHQ